MKFDDAYILSYIERKLPVDDLRECDTLMNSSPEFREKVERIETIYELSENLRKQKKIDTEKAWTRLRSEEHTSELQSRPHLVCRLLLEKKKNKKLNKN